MKMKNTLRVLPILFLILISTNCSDDCTELQNVPKWDPYKKTFVDNYIEVPCGSGKPVDAPVN